MRISSKSPSQVSPSSVDTDPNQQQLDQVMQSVLQLAKQAQGGGVSQAPEDMLKSLQGLASKVSDLQQANLNPVQRQQVEQLAQALQQTGVMPPSSSQQSPASQPTGYSTQDSYEQGQRAHKHHGGHHHHAAPISAPDASATATASTDSTNQS